MSAGGRLVCLCMFLYMLHCEEYNAHFTSNEYVYMTPKKKEGGNYCLNSTIAGQLKCMRDRQASIRVLLIPLRGSDNVIGKQHLSILIRVKLDNTCAHAPQPPIQRHTKMAYKDIHESQLKKKATRDSVYLISNMYIRY